MNRCGSNTRFRVQLKHAVVIDPDKADVLQAIAEAGSIVEPGRHLGASYQRVWSLVMAMNNDVTEPLVLTQRGGNAGGGAQLTPAGAKVLKVYALHGKVLTGSTQPVIGEALIAAGPDERCAQEPHSLAAVVGIGAAST